MPELQSSVKVLAVRKQTAFRQTLNFDIFPFIVNALQCLTLHISQQQLITSPFTSCF